jgi:hypothetical protein
MRSREEGSNVEKHLSLTFEEATALLEMSMFSYMDNIGEQANSALAKLGDLWRDFCSEYCEEVEIDITSKLNRAA